MYAVSNKFRQQEYSGEALFNAKLYINNIIVPNDLIASINLSEPIIDTSVDYFYLGSFISNKLTIKFKNMNELDQKIIENIKSNTEVYLEIGQTLPQTNLLDDSSFKNTNVPSNSGFIIQGLNYTISAGTYRFGLFVNNELVSTNNVYAISFRNGSNIVVEKAHPNEDFTITNAQASSINNIQIYVNNTFVSTYSGQTITGAMITTGPILTYEEYNPPLEYVPIGHFLIDDLSEDYFSKCEITCMDYAIKLKSPIDYSPCFVDNKANLNTILTYICTQSNITIDTDLSTLPNPNIEVGTYDSTVSGKQWVSYIAETKGCNVKIARNGHLILIPFKKTTPDVTINALESAKFELGEKYEISRVIFTDAIRNFTYGTDTYNTLYIRQDNPFIADTSVVQNIYNAVNGMIIYSLKTENYGDISLDCWDLIQYTLGTDENDNVIAYNTYNNCDLTYEMNIASKVETKIPTKQQEITTNVLGDDKARIRKISTDLDYVNGEISMIAQDIDELDDTTADLTTKYSQTAHSISLTSTDNVTTAGLTVKLYNEDGTQLDSKSANIAMSGKVSFTDLSTSNPSTTIINGDNITTGSIKSSNYVANTSGTLLNLTDGKFTINSQLDQTNGGEFKINGTNSRTTYLNSAGIRVEKKYTSSASSIAELWVLYNNTPMLYVKDAVASNNTIFSVSNIIQPYFSVYGYRTDFGDRVNKYNGTVYGVETLYDNSSGTIGTVTLSSSAANYDYLEIFTNQSNLDGYSSYKIANPNGKNISIYANMRDSSNVTYVKSKKYSISGTSITVNQQGWTFTVSGTSIPANNAYDDIYITKVVGYK